MGGDEEPVNQEMEDYDNDNDDDDNDNDDDDDDDDDDDYDNGNDVKPLPLHGGARHFLLGVQGELVADGGGHEDAWAPGRAGGLVRVVLLGEWESFIGFVTDLPDKF